MRIDLEDLRRHYAGLSDEELEEIEVADLTEAARAVYEAEFARRKLPAHQEPDIALEGHDTDEPQEIEDASGEFEIDVGPPPDWLEDAACACTFAALPGNTDLPNAVKARAVLRRAGIPCHITLDNRRMTRRQPIPARRISFK